MVYNVSHNINMKICFLINLLVLGYCVYPLLDLEPLPENPTPDISQLSENYEAPERCVSPVNDQGRCSPWPMVAAQVLSDRFCRSGIRIPLSGQDIINCHLHTCINTNDTGALWNYLQDHGIVADRCMSYTSWTGFASKCPISCEGDEPWRKFMCKEGTIMHLSKASEIKEQILRYGSVMAEMNVYLDFIYHKEGIYVHKKGKENVKDYLGRHPVRCYGYGNEGGVDYWKCANTWSYNWGDKGLFKIKLGEAGIDSSVWACESGKISTES